MAIEQSIKLLSGRKVLLAEGNTKFRAEMGRYLKSIGMEITEAGNATEAIDKLRNVIPALLILDSELPGDAMQCMQVASEPRPAEALRVILTCRARTSREKLISLISPAVGAILIAPCRPELLIDRMARLMEGDTGRPVDGVGAAGSSKPVSLVEGNNSLLLQQVLCPFHEKQTVASRYALRLNHVESNPNFFDVPVYTHAIGRADFVNYHQLCVTVCPDCLFASPDPSHFMMPHDRKHVCKPIPSAARYAIISRVRQRREILGHASNEFFTERRSTLDAVKSFELAMNCSVTLHNAAPRQLSDELVRQGNYHLRIALLHEQMGDPECDRDTHIQLASKLLKDAYSTLSEPSIPRSVYQCVATSIYFGEDAQAHQYLTQLAKLSKQTRDPAIKTSMDRYLFRSARAWENREEHRRRVVETVPMRAPFLDAV